MLEEKITSPTRRNTTKHSALAEVTFLEDPYMMQEPPKGTDRAVPCALEALGDFQGRYPGAPQRYAPYAPVQANRGTYTSGNSWMYPAYCGYKVRGKAICLALH